MINLPPQEELQYKEKQFFQSVYEQFQSSSKIWFVLLLVMLLAAWPLAYFLKQQFASSFIQKNTVLRVLEPPYTAENIKIVKSEILPVQRGIFSAYAQIVNPNTGIAARRIDYRFAIRDQSGAELAYQSGSTYLLAGQSRFVVAPRIEIASGSPAAVQFQIEKVNWTKLAPRSDVSLEILQKNAGTNTEGNFFVEGLVKNNSNFGIKGVDIQVLVFDKTNQNILAVNSTERSDLKPAESRFFRMLWPVNFPSYGEVQVTAFVNLLDPDLVLPDAEKIPIR